MTEGNSHLSVMEDTGYFGFCRRRDSMPEGFTFYKDRGGGGEE